MNRILLILVGLVWAVIVAGSPSALPAAAQTPTMCPDLVREALARVDTACGGTGRNQVCYGNNLIDIETQPNIAPIQFNAVGDITSLLNLTGLRLAGMNTAIAEWGVALMRLQANIPDALPGQNVTAVLFGDTEIAADPDAVTEAGVPFGLARAFLLRTGFNDSQCSEMPDSGLVLQTPGGVDQVTLQINDAAVTLGSTAFIQTDFGGSGGSNPPAMIIQMIEGAGRVEANGVAQYVLAGQYSTVPLGSNGLATGQPTDPLPYNGQNESIPTEALERPIEVPPPLIPSVAAPVITDVVVTRRSDTQTQEEIFFTDPEGDARFVQLSVVDSDPEQIDYSFDGTEIFASPGAQQAGTSILRQTDCSDSPNPIDVLIRVTISDAGGNTSNIVEYRVSCG